MPKRHVEEVLQPDEHADEQAQRDERPSSRRCRRPAGRRRASRNARAVRKLIALAEGPMSRNDLAAGEPLRPSPARRPRQPSAASTTRPGAGPRSASPRRRRDHGRSAAARGHATPALGRRDRRSGSPSRGGTPQSVVRNPSPRRRFADTDRRVRAGHGAPREPLELRTPLGLERLAALLGLLLAVEQQVRVVGELLDAGVAVLVRRGSSASTAAAPTARAGASRGTTARSPPPGRRAGTTVLTSPMSSACCASY